MERLARAEGTVAATEVQGAVSVRKPSAERFVRVRVGDRIVDGSRLRTEEDGKVVLQFPDGTTSRISPDSEIVLRLSSRSSTKPSGVILFFGRLWTSVVRSVSGETTFEVQGANAVAGVRGTQFEVGVADDGAVRVVVSEGLVAVQGDVTSETVNIAPGFEIESDSQGKLLERRKVPKTLEWDDWFGRRARALQERGQMVAEDLHGRLSRRRKQVERLVGQQRRLRQQIERLENRRQAGEDVKAQLQDKLRQLERVTQRLEDMQARLQAAFGMFRMWGRKAGSGRLKNGRQIRLLAEDVKRVEKGFADLFEEGTDQSEESLDEMMDDMQQGPTLKPKKKASDELF